MSIEDIQESICIITHAEVDLGSDFSDTIVNMIDTETPLEFIIQNLMTCNRTFEEAIKDVAFSQRLKPAVEKYLCSRSRERIDYFFRRKYIPVVPSELLRGHSGCAARHNPQ